MVATLYSFYSHAHRSNSRTEHLLSALSVTNSTYHNILISDPSLVSVNFRNILSHPEYNWCFNLLHLEDQPFTEHLANLGINWPFTGLNLNQAVS